MIIKNGMGDMLREVPNKWKIVLLDIHKKHIKTLDIFESEHGGADNHKTLTFKFIPNGSYDTDYIQVYYDDIFLHEIEKHAPHIDGEQSTVEVKVYI